MSNLINSKDLDSWIDEAIPFIPRIGTVNIKSLLKAICWQESSYGKRPIPRHENNWCPNQKIVSSTAKYRHSIYGCLACCSYGPMQVLYHSLADLAIVADPVVLIDQKTCFNKSIAFLIRKLLRDHPTTVSAVADIWNSGNNHDTIVPLGYINSVEKFYLQVND